MRIRFDISARGVETQIKAGTEPVRTTTVDVNLAELAPDDRELIAKNVEHNPKHGEYCELSRFIGSPDGTEAADLLATLRNHRAKEQAREATATADRELELQKFEQSDTWPRYHSLPALNLYTPDQKRRYDAVRERLNRVADEERETELRAFETLGRCPNCSIRPHWNSNFTPEQRARYQAAKERFEQMNQADQDAKAQAEAAREQAVRDWIEAHGSDHLRRVYREGYTAPREYLQERLTATLGAEYGFDRNNDENTDTVHGPSEAALDELARVRGVPGVIEAKIVWLTEPDGWHDYEDGEYTPREAVQVDLDWANHYAYRHYED